VFSITHIFHQAVRLVQNSDLTTFRDVGDLAAWFGSSADYGCHLGPSWSPII